MDTIYRNPALFSAFRVGTSRVRRDQFMDSARMYRRENLPKSVLLCVQHARDLNRELVAELRKLSATGAA